MRRRDPEAWARVRAVLALEGSGDLSHTEVAAEAKTTYEVVRAVRRGRPQPSKPRVRGLSQRFKNLLLTTFDTALQGGDTRALLLTPTGREFHRALVRDRDR